MMELLANSALTWDVRFTSGAALMFAIVFGVTNIVKFIFAAEADEEGGIILSLLSLFLIGLYILCLSIYTNAYEAGATAVVQ